MPPKTKVLLLSPNTDFCENIKNLLKPYGTDRYSYLYSTEIESENPEFDIVLIDEISIGSKPQIYLAQYIFEFSPEPVIYICEKLDDPAEYSAVKSLATDYFYKDQLTGSGLHNSIKYILEASLLKKEIEKKERRYQSLFYNAVDPAFYLDSEWKIENVNQAFTETFGTSLHLLLGKEFTELFMDLDDAIRLKHLLLNKGKTTFEDEIRFQKFDKKGHFPGHLKLSALREYTLEEGENTKRIIGFHGTLSNTSDRKRLQKFREASERLDMTYRLARTLAHEIRNPLTNITLSINQLEEEIGQSEDAQMYLDIVNRCTKRIDKLIDQLLLSSHRQDIKGSECDLIQIVLNAVNDATDRAKLRNIDLVTDFEADAIPYFCDAEKITLAISNLITNAIESIEGESGQVIVGTYTEGEYYIIYVEDNGIGMNEDQKKSVFDPFFSNKSNGLGLGLTTTQGIILEHEGQIELESEPGVGSTFSILLPKSQLKVIEYI